MAKNYVLPGYIFSTEVKQLHATDTSSILGTQIIPEHHHG